ncbi:helix-turn-helix transcriptional regulator [Klebsiella quasipneumoniae]|uniref:helix-turn-helix transcriptional regulator n=1 Tax=Klebsiella quasipneumoniae TaxID=1463165 RepID=UPI00249A2E0C|nr:helix-turn-helix transcriptional regulator [Klebsiella quasipneumoniae]MDI3070051.1 helix-turn-helix transcriptional regulator [Klebsiella quasipneumoniae]HBR1597800.1 helix-turn-helix domain-containing protein [Klebsiella quasipneumoniae subsp. quasipneumoniae]HCD2264599.1 helix-turn-helix domain-containing protein [Klebsiella quasipneumoniae]HCI6148299.1 helix-turn-helix domain-containing protein [Klebsiella quasipneumoniae subsp. quasipneumoniae]
MNTSDNHALGDFLRARRQRLDPATFGFPAGRRRTPGLRREEVAQLASISPTWYTWLEQGRGGAPSREVLERIARGLRLTAPEREHLFILAFGHPPQTRLTITDDMTPRLQRVLDAFAIPAIIRTASWDVIAWNAAAARVLTDYGQLPLAERNVLRRLFTRPEARCTLEDWQTVGQLIVNAFRADVTRMGATTETDQLIAELSQQSVEFARFWQSHDVAGHGESYKRIHHPQMGPLDLEFTSFAVEGRPDLSLLVFNPATTESQRKIHGLLQASGSSSGEY